MSLRDKASAAFDALWLRCETSVVWFTVTAATVAVFMFVVGLGIVVLIWR